MMVGHRTSSRVSENPCGPAELLHCPHLTGFCWQLDGNMENAKWRTLLFDLRGGYGLYVHCVEALLTSVCANSTHLKSEDFIAKRFVYGKSYVWDNHWVEPPIGKPCGIWFKQLQDRLLFHSHHWMSSLMLWLQFFWATNFSLVDWPY